jgi:hypothetical protein
MTSRQRFGLPTVDTLERRLGRGKERGDPQRTGHPAARPAYCHLGFGKRRTGKRQEATEHLATATTMYREIGMTYWLEQAERYPANSA